MTKLSRFTLLFLIFALLALPVFADGVESTETPVLPDESPIVVVMPESPETGDLSDPNTFIKALMLISLLGNLLQAFWSMKSVPPEIAKLIFSVSRELAKTTKDTKDDKAVDMLERTYDDLSALRPKPELPYNPSDNRS